MPETDDPFGCALDQWNREESEPWQQVRRQLEFSNLARHRTIADLDVLDAGGGNGHGAISFLKKECRVVVVDSSIAMLQDGEKRLLELGLGQNAELVPGELEDLPPSVRVLNFDIVLCHNVLQYVNNPREVLTSIVEPLRRGGLLSIVCPNRFSLPYRQAFVHDDVVAARAAVDARVAQSPFGVTVPLYSVDDLVPEVEAAGCRVLADYGLRCIFDYLGSRNQQGSARGDAEALEFALSPRHPYKLLAWFFQIVAIKV